MEQHINVLIGCDEPLVVDALRILLTTAAQDGRTYQFTTSSRAADFIKKARSGEFDLAIMHANCLVPARPLTLFEQALLAVKNIKASCSLRLVVLTTTDEWVSPLRDSGAEACLRAPFASNQLLGAISTPA